MTELRAITEDNFLDAFNSDWRRDNPAARKLYERRGFRTIGVEDEDEIELVLLLE